MKNASNTIRKTSLYFVILLSALYLIFICCNMKKLIISLIFLVALSGCKNKDGSNKKTNDNLLTEVKNDSYSIYQKLLGAFVGLFDNNVMMVRISKITNDSITGSITGEDVRFFKGIITQKEGTYNFNAYETGEQDNDGTFNFTIDEKNADIITGSWTPYNKSAGNAKKFVLERKPFVYNPALGEYKASQKLLHVSDVENLLKDELEIMRNEIFARHGFCFSNKTLRKYFESQDWYVPYSYNVRNDLTEIEKKNIALIRRYEKYSEEYGDDFGR